ncbi:hypothetical protein [Brevundimonas aveniformis]|uniref:hypothetical protein n=1 Tax=Brevundimonas aveniformis TaxID=370977 RepID=UPI0024919F05|nr:hypothetical protein [Brevundimonas aveniformis]
MLLRTLAALLLLLSAAPALAQPDHDLPGPRECLDDDHTDRCDPEVQARVRDLLGIASIEDEAASGAIVYRALFVDGYGRDMPAVAFERRPGQSPEVVIYGREGRTVRAPASSEAWDAVVAQSRFADRELAPIRDVSGDDPDVESVSICLHAWVQTVEIANAARARLVDEPVRRRTESACGGGLTTRFAFFLADLAVEQIPWCDQIDADTERNAVTQLDTCLMLSGDRLAAADLYNARLADVDWTRDDGLNVGEVRAHLGVSSPHTLTWGDQVVQAESWSDRNVAEFLLARFADHPYLRFWPTNIEGVNAEQVVVRGIAEATFGDVRVSAAYTQTWLWHELSLVWGLSDWSVEPFTPVSRPN